MMRKGIMLTAIVSMIATVAAATDYYVDTDSLGGPASDVAPGTKEKPWKTIARAFGTNTPKPTAGDTVYVRDGVYKEAGAITIKAGGAPGKPLVIKVFPGEEAVLDGEAKISMGIALYADYVTIDGLKLANIIISQSSHSKGQFSVAIFARGCKGIIIQNVEITEVTGIGIYLLACANCRILKSNVHHCDTPIHISAPSSDIVIADNHVHHSLSGNSPCINLWGGADAIILRGGITSIEAAGPGLARFTVGDEKALLNKKNLQGKADVAVAVDRGKDTNYILFYYSEVKNSSYDEKEVVVGGTVRLQDGHRWFVLHNNPEWGNKPCSPDGRQGLFEIGEAKLEDLAGARYFLVAAAYDPATHRNRDIQILRNHVHDSAGSGILAPCAEYVLMQGNRVHDSGVTGIQVETASRHLWIEGNEIYANNLRYSGETCLWLDEDIDAVVQNNILYESQIGLEVSQCARILARRNVIYNNRAQHNTTTIDQARGASSGIVLSRGALHMGAPSGLTESAFVHNTLYGNGTAGRMYNFGGLVYGNHDLIGRNIVLNNIIRNENRDVVLLLGRVLPLRMDGNVYYVPGNVADVTYRMPDSKEKKIYSLLNPEGFEKYRQATGCDAHSLFGDVAFVDAKGADFHLARGSMAIDKGVPLARTMSAGKGKEVPVDNVWCFSAGFKNSKGETLIPGDEIMVGKIKGQIAAIDREKSLLIMDQIVRWKKDAPVNYVYNGAAPDVGAFEAE